MGLMNEKGEPVTPAIYTSISAISQDLYKCSYTDNEAVLLDSNGKNVNNNISE